MCCVLFLVCWYICVCERLLQNNIAGVPSSRATSRFPQYCASTCARFGCTGRHASCVDSKQKKKNRMASLQSILSNSFLWKRTNWSVVIHIWSWRGKPAASAQAVLWEANAERFYFIFPEKLLPGAAKLKKNEKKRFFGKNPVYTLAYGEWRTAATGLKLAARPEKWTC